MNPQDENLAVRSFPGCPPPALTFWKGCFPCCQRREKWQPGGDCGGTTARQGLGEAEGGWNRSRGKKLHSPTGLRGLQGLRQEAGMAPPGGAALVRMCSGLPDLSGPFCKTAEAANMAQRNGPHKPWQGGFNTLCACFRPLCRRQADLGAWPLQTQEHSRVSLRLKWLGLKFQLLWGHLALCPTNSPRPKTSAPVEDTGERALLGDQEKPQPASMSLGPQAASEGSNQAAGLRGPYGEAPNWPEGTPASPSPRPSKSVGLQGPEIRPHSTQESRVAQTHPGPRGERRRDRVNQHMHLLHPCFPPAHRTWL